MKITRFAAVLLALAVVSPIVLATDEEPPPRTAKDVVKDLKDRDRGVKLLAIAESSEFQDAAVTSQLVKMVKEKDPEVRMAVIEALGNRKAEAEKKRAAAALAPRLKVLTGKVLVAEEYEAVIGALRKLAQPVSIKALLDMKVEEDPATALARLMAVAEVPRREAIDALIRFGSKGRNRGSNHQREYTARALRYATGQKWGRDMDKWRQWWRENRDTFDFEMIREERTAAEKAAAERKARQKAKRQKRKRNGS